MTLIRHRQVGITRVSPHAGNKRYAIPGGERGRITGAQLDATYYNGVDDYVLRTTPLVGAPSASTEGTLSVWFRVDGGDGTVRTFMQQNFLNPITYNSSRSLSVRLSNSSDSIVLNLTQTGVEYEDGEFHHLVCSWNMQTGAWHFYVDDALVTMANSTVDNDVVDFSRQNTSIGSNSGGAGLFFNGCIGEFYFNMSEYADLSEVSERRKFITAAHGPIDLLANPPLISAPQLYMVNGGRDGINSGTGGNFDNISAAPVKCTIPGPQV